MAQILAIRTPPLLLPSASTIHNQESNLTPSKAFENQRYDTENRIPGCRYRCWSLQTDGGNCHLRPQPSLYQVGSDSSTPPSPYGTLTQLLSCVQTIEDVLSTLTPPPYSIDVSIALQSVRVRHNPSLVRETIELAIESAGFDIESPIPRDSITVTKRESFSQTISGFFAAKQSKHIAQCLLCQSDEAHAHVISQLPVSEKILEDSGSPAEEQGPTALSLSIGGMTCTACSNTLTRLLSEVDGVSNVVVDLMGHSARVVVDSQKLTPAVIETIEDAGFDGEVVKTEPMIKTPTQQETTSRTISLKVDGMYCQ